LVSDEDEVPAGTSCARLAGSGTGQLGESTDEFWLREETKRKGHTIEWGSFDETLGSRFFDREFLKSGEVERFLVTEPSGREHSFMVWGGYECEPCPSDFKFESHPGDPWGCGTSSGDGDGDENSTLM
jgi:hypothetical protein